MMPSLPLLEWFHGIIAWFDLLFLIALIGFTGLCTFRIVYYWNDHSIKRHALELILLLSPLLVYLVTR